MKVLWFTNTPCLASEILNPHMVIGGWLSSLEEQLVKNEDIELSICFFWGSYLSSFELGKTKYYPVHRPVGKSKITRIIKRVINKINDDKVEILKLLSIVNIVKPDIIHIHGSEDNFGLIQSYTDIPVVLSVQGLLSAYAEKFYSGIPSCSAYIHEGLIPKLMFNSSSYWYRYMRNCAKREVEILLNTKNIIGRTSWDKRVTSVLAPKANYFTGNEILRSTFYKSHWSKNKFNSTLRIVTIMSGGLYKGLETIVKTTQILKFYNTINFEWVVIGQSESSASAKIVKHWLKCDFNNLNIKLIGSQNGDSIVNILINSDIYCQVSHIENSPNSVCEAMLLGMPIIASFAGGTDSIIDNNNEGILVQDGDPYSFAGAIKDFSTDFQKASFFANNAHKHAIIRHSPDIICKQLLITYKEILNK